MDKKTKLILAQSLLLFFMILIFGNIIIYKQGNIFLRNAIKQKITDFYQENYENKDLIATDLMYHAKEKSYSITYYHKDIKDYAFDIIYKNKKITSTYQEDYIEGKKLLEKRTEKLQKKWQKALKDTAYQNCQISFLPLNQYTQTEKNKILKNDHINRSYLYQVTCIIPTNEIEKDHGNQLINTLDIVATANQFYPQKYTFISNNHDIMKEIIKKEGDTLYE